MSKIKIFANAKVNLGLDVLGKRSDGYHNIKTIMHTVYLSDIIYLEKVASGNFEFICDNPDIPTDSSNLCVKAYDLIAERFKEKATYKIVLEKHIPAQAGLGGGSADAAAIIRALNELENIGLEKRELCEIGASIGADVPFCIMGGCMMAEGIGEVLSELPAIDTGHLLIIKPKFNISTPEGYRQIDESERTYFPDIEGIEKAIRTRDLHELCPLLNRSNVFESVLIKAYPQLKVMLDFLLENGAEAASLSGSGAAFYGIFNDELTTYKCKEKFDNCFSTDFSEITSFVKGR